MKNSYLRSVYLRLAGVVMLAVVLALAANAFLSHRSFERALGPEMAKKVAIVGGSIRVLLLKAVDNGIAFDQLYGVEDKFAEWPARSPRSPTSPSPTPRAACCTSARAARHRRPAIWRRDGAGGAEEPGPAAADGARGRA
jgi:hypothetical protein